jgi:galactokinase
VIGHPARAFAPGRVNLIGEHTDYNEGLALAFAVAAGVTVTATATAGASIEAVALDLGERDVFGLRQLTHVGGWRGFVRGAVAELQELGYEIPAARIEIAADLPRGVGMSSSAALAMALCLALIELAGDAAPDQLALARLGQRIEHEWVGAQTGLLDQLASLGGGSGQALLIDFRSLETRSIPLELGNHRLVVLDSGETHVTAASEYNRRRAECREAACRIGVESLRDAKIQDLHVLPDALASRARHVISENGRVLAAVDALMDGEPEQLGRLLDLSHASLRDDYEVSTPMVEDAVLRLKRSGALGARILGGGFGGSVLGLLPVDAIPPTGSIVVAPSPGARLLS